MKVEKFVKLTVDYEHIDISPEWVAFSVSRTLENTFTQKGITDKTTWNNFVQDPFSSINHNKITNYDIVLVNPDTLLSQPSFKKSFVTDSFDNVQDTDNVVDFYNEFDFDFYKKNPYYAVYKKDYVAQKNSGKNPEFYYLQDLNNKVTYFECTLFIPYNFITETQENRIVFSTLHSLVQLDNFEMIPFYKDCHSTKKEYLEGFLNAIDGIDEPYVGDENDFCTPSPEFMSEIGSLKFKIPGFTDFDEFFTLTKKYVSLDNMGICEKNFSLIMNLAILKSFYNDNISEDFFKRFGEDYKIAQCISMEYKLKPKNNNTKRPKI